MRIDVRQYGLVAGLLIPALLAAGCASLLGISEPVPREDANTAGTGGSSGSSGTAGGVSGASGDDSMAARCGGQAGETLAGNGGTSLEPCTVLGLFRCGGEASLAPEICDGNVWRARITENDGQPCPTLCVEGECVECNTTEPRCVGAQVQRCIDGAWQSGPNDNCDNYCLDGACQNPRSCDKLGNRRCGSDDASCCQALEVPGGTFARSYDGEEYRSNAYTATVSSFLLDRFEVSVGRFAEFVDKYDTLALRDGDGKAPHIQDDQGWQSVYRNLMPADAASLRAELKCPNSTWLDSVNANLNLPINCVSFYVAYAFCVWDGGRLPTEAEWNYAAAGGDEQRVYPWTTGPDQGPDSSYAYYGQVIGTPIDIGSKPKGNGRWGHSDLAGNVAEWVLDYMSKSYPATECNDCVSIIGQDFRVLRGGGYLSGASRQKASFRGNLPPSQTDSIAGFRCVHDFAVPALK
jgi:formylglycine-generating enzyme